MTYTVLPPSPGAPRGEFVYFMYSAGRIKIGYSRGSEGRLKTLKTAAAFPPVIVLVMHGSMGDEADFHIRFHADRLHGEWFTLSPNIRRFLNRRLCDDGMATLDRAETEFRAYCASVLDLKPPPKSRKPRLLCDHGRPVGSLCPPCERERDFAILKRIDSGAYNAQTAKE